MRILLSDVSYRKAFDVYNCIRRLGYPLILADRRSTTRNMFVYGRPVHKLRADTYKAFAQDLTRLLANYGDEEIVVLPCEEDTTLRFLEHTENEGRGRLRFALPSKESFELVRHKKSLSVFCQQSDIPCPQALKACSLRRHFVKAIAKPDVGAGASGVIYVNTCEDVQMLDHIEDNYLIQEQLPSSKHVLGSFFLFNQGKLVSYYGHRRIRTYPATGGVTVYSKIDYNPELEKVGTKLLSKLGWHGFAMVEFLYDPRDKQYKVIEVNPRLWGSFLLAEFANTGFLENYVRIATGKEPKAYTPSKEVYIRWFFPFDLINYIRCRGRIDNFWAFDMRKTCYIGFTYSSLWRSMSFLLVGLLDSHNLQLITRKLFSR